MECDREPDKRGAKRMMWWDLDLFACYRWLLAIVCTVYTVVRLVQTAHGWIVYFWSPYPRIGVLRRYALLQVLRIRVRRFTLDLLQIAGLTAALFALLWLHHRLGYVS
jgi:hypothetical protein